MCSVAALSPLMSSQLPVFCRALDCDFAFHLPTRGPRVGARGGFSISRVGSYLGIHCKARVGSGRRRRSVAKGWGPGTRERQHASRDTIPERWGERTNPRTQAQLSLNRSALAAGRLQLPTLAKGVGKTNFISQLQPRQRKRPPAGHVDAAARPGIPPYLLLLFLVHVFVSVHCMRRFYTCWCVCRVS